MPDNLNVHSLRHTNASMLIAQGVDVRTVAGLLGHDSRSRQELCAKLCTALVEIYYRGRLNRPLITLQQAGRKGSRAAVGRSSCP